MNALESAGSLILVLGILVLVHESGHFLVAKAFGIGVRVFSIGFGPRIAGVRRRDTDYRVSAVPLGGYVRLAGDEADEHRTGAPEEFLTRPRWQRFLVFVAGATFNVALAVLLSWVVIWQYGEPYVAGYPVVNRVAPGSPAAEAGFEPGDRILEIAGRDARNEQVEFEEIVMAPDTTREVVFDRDGRRHTVELDTGQDPRYHMGFPGWVLVRESGEPTVVASVAPGSPAEAAGLEPGDRIVGADGTRPIGEVEIRRILAGSPGRDVTLTIERDATTRDIVVRPNDEGGQGRIGAGLYTELPRRELGAAAAFSAAVRVNVERSAMLFFTLKQLFQGRISVRAFSGPIEISQFSRQAVASGAETFLTFLAFISLQLGILNLLPIPVLDGGHILILGVESVMRRDLSEPVKEKVMLAGLLILLTFFGVVITFDVLKLT